MDLNRKEQKTRFPEKIWSMGVLREGRRQEGKKERGTEKKVECN